MTKLDRFLLSIEPFALTLVILAGANLAGWVQFSQRDIVGTVTVFFGVLLMIKHVTTSMRSTKK